MADRLAEIKAALVGRTTSPTMLWLLAEVERLKGDCEGWKDIDRQHRELAEKAVDRLEAEVERLKAANRARDELAAECAARRDVDVRERLATARDEGMEAAAVVCEEQFGEFWAKLIRNAAAKEHTL